MWIKFMAQVMGFSLMIGTLTIAIFVAGAILGIVLAFLVPVGLLFTGVGLIWFLVTDFSPEKPAKEQ